MSNKGTIEIGGTRSVAVGDLNGDGIIDVTAANTKITDGSGASMGICPAICKSIADVNGDGKPDIVIADEIFDEVSVLLRQ